MDPISLFRNMPPVTKNLLIINVIVFLATVIFERQGIYLNQIGGLHYMLSDGFAPYQIVTHFFMHADFGHLFFNMFGLVMFGIMLEHRWGAKRFLIFYLVTALGAAILHNITTGIFIHNAIGIWDLRGTGMILPPTVGASGAIYGLLAGIWRLFPNMELMLIFLPIPIKAKYFVPGLMLISLYMGIARHNGDNIAHFAHLGGALIGILIIWIWQRNRNRFY